jgi:proline iminopeptidase
VKGENQMETKTIKVNDIELRVKITGKGQPILVASDTVVYPRLFSEFLKNHYQWIFAETRYTVPTPKGFDKTIPLWSLMADELEIIREELGLGKVTILGHSMLGLLAFEYARKYPGNVTSVVALGTPPNFGPAYASACEEAVKAADPQRLAIAAQRLRDFGGQEKLDALNPDDRAVQENIINSSLFLYDKNSDLAPFYEGGKFNGELLTEGLAQATNYDVALEPRVNAPVLICAGKYDYVVPPSTWTDAEKAKLPNLTFHIFEKSGHMMMYEEPDEFERIFNQWMSSH